MSDEEFSDREMAAIIAALDFRKEEFKDVPGLEEFYNNLIAKVMKLWSVK